MAKKTTKKKTKKATTKKTTRRPSKSKSPERDVERIVLQNGVRVISEQVKDAPAVVFGVWLDAGSRYEDLNESGATHVIQRLSFHGTEQRSAAQIAKAVDALGGDVWIETDRDYANYQAQVEPESLEDCVNLLADLVLRPTLTKTALSAEATILLEELREAEKDADFNLERMFLRSLWKGHGLCRPPRGRLLTVRGHTRIEDFKPKRLQSFHTRSHRPEGMTIVASGDIEHAEITALAEKYFGELETPKKTVSTTSPPSHKFLAFRNRPQFSKVRFQLGFPTCPAADDLRHVAALLNCAIAAGPGSKLKREVSEGDLPALDIESVLEMYADTGCIWIRARTARKQAVEALEKTVAELRALTVTPLEDDAMSRIRARRKTDLMKDLDSLRTRATSLARSERYFGRIAPLTDEIAALQEVTPEKLHQIATTWITPYNLSLAMLGDLKGVKISPRLLSW